MTIAGARASSTSRDTLILFSTTVLALLGSIGTQSCLAWFLAPAGRGAFAVCVSFASVAAVVFGLASDRAIQYQLIARNFSLRQATLIAYVSTLVSAAVAAAVCWALIGSSHPFFEKADAASFRLSLLLIPLIGLTNALSLMLAGVGRFAAMGGLNVFANLANLFLTLLLVGMLGLGVEGAIWALALAYALAILLRTRAAWEGARFEWPRLADFVSVASYGLRYYAARLGNVANAQIGMIVMAWVALPAEIGLFAAASALISRLSVIPDSISTAIIPRVGPNAGGQPALVSTASRTALLTVGAALAALLLSSGVVVPVLLSPAYSDAVALLWLMAPGVWLKSASKPTTSYFIGMNRPGIVSLSTALELVGNAIALPLLYRRFGIAGAAAATSLASSLASFSLIAAFHFVSGVGFGVAWIPRRSDFARFIELRGHLAPKPRSSEIPPRGGNSASRIRELEILHDRVVKRRPSALISVEAEKTARAAEIGAASGLFRAPLVLETNVEQGWMAIERIDGLVPLHTLLLKGPSSGPLVGAAGRALAVIHKELTLPASMRHPLPAPWAAPDAGVDVALHGDFNTRNLFVCTGTGELVVTDWETSLRAFCPGNGSQLCIPTVGPRYFDLAWFIASLFGRTWFGLSRVVDAPRYAEVFLQSYFATAGSEAQPAGFTKYLPPFADAVEVREAEREESLRDKFLHPRSRIRVSSVALGAFARSLANRQLERN